MPAEVAMLSKLESDESGYRVRIQIGALPELPRTIRSRHWTVQARHRDQWHALVAAALAGKRPAAPLERATLILTRHSAQEPDRDNLMASWKDVIDGLRHAGVILNDKRQNIGTPDSRWEKAGHKNGHVTIEVIES